MREQTTFTIDGFSKSITVKELSVRQILEVFNFEGLSDSSVLGVYGHFQNSILPVCSNLEADEVLDFTPSDLKAVWEKFREVNSVFFDILSQTGVTELLQSVQEEIKTDLKGRFGKRAADLLNPDTPTASSTATASSSTPSTSTRSSSSTDSATSPSPTASHTGQTKETGRSS